MVPCQSKSLFLRLCVLFASVLLLPGHVFAQTGNVIVATSTTWATGTYNVTSLTVENGAVLTIGGGSTVTANGAITVTANSSIVLQSINNSAQVNGAWQGVGVTMSAGSVEVDSGSSINADGQGYVASAGPGGAPAGTSAGGSYGGIGGVGAGTAALAVYGSSTVPTALGSGGGVRCCSATAGAGGGAVILTVSGILTNNGIISANGGNATNQAGGGAGGSVSVTTATLAGAGFFEANGGSNGEAAGGGGRVAVYYNASSGNFSGFTGSTASGGTCPQSCSNGTSSNGSVGTAAFFDTSATNDNLTVYQNFTLPASSSISYNSINVTAGALLTIGGGTTVNVASALTVSGTVVAQSINNSAEVNGAWAGSGVAIKAASITVASTGSLNADAQGYVQGAGPGGAPSGTSSGGSYGGLGGSGVGGAVGPVYGSTTNPTDLGSGGNVRCCSTTGGSGGGALTLTVSGTLTDNGIISANGGAVVGLQAGGGSGGTVYIQTTTLAGSGVITSTGGSGNGEAAGGGGRIAVYYTTNSSFNLDSVTADGGTTTNGTAGAIGTVYSLSGGSSLTVSNNTVLPPNSTFTFTAVTVNNQATLTLGSGTTLNANSITVTGAATMTVGGGSTLNVTGAVLVTGKSNMVLQSINNSAQVNGTWQGTGVTLNAASVEVDSGSTINADGQGYTPNAGPGGAPSGSSAGGSYGGIGGVGLGVAPAATYGSTTAPTDLGSGGSVRCCSTTAGNGGGAIRMVVSGVLTNNGVISANGGAVIGLQAGAGAAGSVYVTTNGLVGAGIFSAVGGTGGEAAGGGGRIAVYYNATASSFTGFSGSTSAGGVCGNSCSNGTSSAGSVGTEAFYDTSATNNNLSVYQDQIIPAGSVLTYNSITVQAGALLTIGGGSTITVTNALTVNGTVVAQSINNTAQINNTWAGQGVTINAASIVVPSGGSLNTDGQGYVGGAGPGAIAGAGNNGSSAGGSYGGQGGIGDGVSAGPIYGSTTAPTDLGSGGASRCCSAVAGSGGGDLRLIVSGTITNNGIISSNGGPVVGLQAGGGSGGAVYVTTSALMGAGAFTANGGVGGEAGGGGGRVAVYYNATVSQFTGYAASTATAGGCANDCSNGTSSAGSNGTSAFYDTSATNTNLMVYQDQTIPAGSVVNYNSITVENGSVLTIGGGSTINVAGSFTVSGTVVAQSINNTAEINGTWQGSGVAINAASLVINTGSSLNADGQGYVAGAGPGAIAGAGNNGSSAGGSYGGLGGVGDGVAAAAVYGSSTKPTDLGSGGASRCCSAAAGAGGGGLTLTISGTLTNNGIISANGAAVVGLQAGGGSGGAVLVTTNGLSGSGVFEANGGLGGEAGGGGGRVALYYNGPASNFTGFAGSTASAGGCGNNCSNGTSSAGSNGTAAFFDTSVTNNNLSVYQNFTIPASSAVNYNNITVQNGALITIGGGASVTVADTLSVTGTIVAQSINNTALVNGAWVGSGVTLNAATLQVAASGSINADTQGYVASAGPGAIPGAGNNGSSAGGSYGGVGGTGDGFAAAPTYGSPTAPTDLGSGGTSRCCGAVPGAGGGAIAINVTGTLTDNGIISANGGAVNGLQAGGGSGGALNIHTGIIAGSGTIAANGGSGNGEAGGAGGRVALYFNTNSGFNLVSATASGATTTNGNAGGAGTVYTLGAGTNLTVAQNTVLPANANLTYSTVIINNGGTFTLGTGTSLTAGSINVAAAGTFTVGGGSTVTDNGALVVTGNSNVVLQSLNNSGPVNNSYVGTGVTVVAASVEVDAGSTINADSQGYLAGAGPGAGPSGSSDGGSYGGLGGNGSGVPPASTYGSATTPTALGSGGNSRCCGAIAGPGGGAMRLIVGGTLTDNGVISANGGAVNGLQAGGGSGGSLFIVTNTLAGTGAIQANGGAGGEASGGGGRVAVYYLTNTNFPVGNALASGGTAGVAGANGTVELINAPTSVFLLPTQPVIHGTSVTVQWFTNVGGPSTVTLAGPQTATIATGTTGLTTATFDTTQFPDGSYQLILTALNNAGQPQQPVVQSVVINNSVAWHSGTLTASQTWSGPQVQALDGQVIVPAGVILTILPGTIVKALPGAEIIVQSGGTLIANGTSTAQVIFTTFDDYTVGGDTDFNQGISVPSPGEWNGVAVLSGGTFTENTNTILRYVATTLSGSLTGSTTFYSTQVYAIQGTLVVPSGVTLNIQPGAIIKLGPAAGIDVQPGATMTANGTLSQPIYFTSYNDISIGGDTNNTGGAIAPAPGDWNSIILDGATVSMQHVQMQYGGGPLNSGAQAGMLETTDNANVTISDSVFAYSFFIGIQTGYPNGGGDTVTLTDSIFYGIEDRAINAYPGSTVHVVNDTFDGNAYGVFAHGGVVDMENSVVSNSIGTQFGAVEACCGSTFVNLSNNDVYNPAKGVTNYTGVTDPTGTLGNISANPVYMNQALHDYRPTYGSPLIDAGNGTVSNYPLTDSFGLARYNDPLVTTKTGTPDVNGKYPDMGAFEFVQTAPSNLDFTVSAVDGPATATVGTQVQVTWTVTNIGAGTAYGPWHDAVYLVTDPGTNTVETLAGMALEGTGIVLGPGATYNATATITVPGVTVGPHRWEVKTNVLGEIFEGANTANNTGVALNEVNTDLAQLVAGATGLSGSFSGIGQSSYYKVVPSATQTTQVQLALNAGYAGSVQLFVGAGYVPSPQRYDFQQTQFDSSTATVIIPSGSTETYYVTAYAQALTSIPAAFTIQASTVSFSLTSVTPGNVVASGSATLTFTGGGFTNSTTFALVAANGTTYTGTATFLADSAHADVTFAVGQIPTGKYSAEAINGSSVTLANAVTLSTGVAVNATNPTVQVTLDTPAAFRAGFPSVITLHYTNISPDDIPAPLIYVAAGNATIAEIAPPCSTCSANYQQQYAATFNSGLVLGINQQGPAGVLPSGASGSIQFMATPISSGTASFYASPDAVDPLAVQLTLAQNLCYQTTGIVEVVCYFNASQVGAYASAANLCAGITPTGADTEGQQRACMAMLNNAGYSYQNLPTTGTFFLGPQSDWNQFAGGHVTAANFNALLAADATALSQSGIYTYDVQSLLAYELQKDGLSQLVPRYHQGAFGFGASHPFDIKLSGNAVTYPDGTVRSFPIASPTQANVFLGLVGDYGTLTLESDSSYLLTEPSGVQLHFAASTDPLDYIQDRDGNRITMGYTNNLVTSAKDNFGNAIAFAYDSLGHITQYTDFAGRVTNFTYDILPDTQHSTFLRSVSNSGGTTSITWNEGDSYGVGYFADSCVTTYCEPAIGITSITYADGSQANYTYDAVGRVTSLSRNGGAQSVSFTYNNDGSITTTDNLGKSTRFGLNQGAEIASITDPLGNLTKIRCDGEGKAISIVGALGDSTFGTYDSLGNLNSVTSPRGSLASLSFTGDQSPTSLSDPDGNASSFSYDSGFDLTTYAFPNGSKTTYTYNAQGQPLTVTNRRGNTITFTYTTQGLLATKTYANGSQVLYSYDGHQNLTSVSAPLGTTKFTYDSADRPLSQTNPDGTSLQFTYNANGQRASMTDSTGFVTNYLYDAVGRLTGLTNSTGASIVTYGYDADGQLISKTLANGTSTSYVRDADGNTTSVINYSATKAVLSEYDYTFDGEGNPLTMKAPNGTYSYTYDLDGQLTGVTTPTGSIQYAYDASGNRTSVTTNGVAATYEPNNLNEYQVANNVPYQYDADGDLISGNGYTYTYDDEGKLLTMVSSSDNWSFQYDGLNNRVASVHNGTTIHYLIDLAGFGDGNVEAEFSGTGSLVAHYTYGLGLTSTVPASGSANYYHFDGTGNTAQITNSAGTVVNSYTYLPFGEQTVLSSGITNPFTYNGQNGALDDGSGLYFMRNRTYDSAIGRFHRQDPLGLESDLNLYRYVNNSPVEFSDPTGLTALDDFTQATSDSAAAHTLNATSGFANNSGLSGVASGVGAVGSIASAAQNAANGNTSYAVHDVTLAVLGVVSNILPPEPPPGPAAVLYYVVKYAGTIDEVSQNYFNLQQQAYQNSIYQSPFAKDPQSVCGACLTHKTPPVMTPINSSIDPNGKLTSGYGNNAYVPAGQPIVYTIFFENQSSATLPAQKVTVTDSLPTNLDWSTVQFDNISFNNVSLSTPTTAQTYTTQATVSTDPNPVAVAAALNPATGVLTFTMQSVDPVTGGAPANPLAGFLPPNNSANAGVGSVTFSVVPKSGLANGAIITNQASIVFDVNTPIVTNSVSNTLDTSTVTSAISPLPASTTSPYINVSWSGSDASGSGIAYYNIYVSIDNGGFALWLSATTLTSSTYTAITGHSYTFYSTATNNVGIQQTTPGTPQTIVVTQGVPTVTVTPAASSITTTQSLAVGVAVASPVTGGAVPTGTVTLSSGSYTSAAATLASGSASITIPAGALAAGTDTLTAVYLPDTAGKALYTGNSGTAQVTVGTSGTTAPVASLSPSALTFTSVSGTTSAAQTVQLSNTGNAALTITGVTLTGTGAASFAQTSSCGASLPAGFSCNISITFTPSSVGSFSASLSVADNASGSPQTVTLSGTGTAVPAPVASVTPTSLSFTSTSGVASAVQTAQLSNTGSAALTISGITIAGTGAAAFTQTNTCGTSLAAGASCTVSITFTPSSAASFTATLSIADNASGSPQTVSLTGTGTGAPAPVASVTPAALTFTSTSGTTSAAQTATLANTGNAALTIGGITITGTGAAAFAQTSTCGTSLAAGANCSISITFTPSSVASFSASLLIADNASGSPQAVSLSGTGTAAATPVASVTPTSLTFTSANGTASAAQIATLSNTGSAALNLSGVTITGTGAAAFAQTNTCGTSLAAGAKCSISVTFTPSSVASFSATLSIADNSSGSPQTVSLTGTGTAAAAPIAAVTPSSLTFTSAAGTASAAQIATLSNTGNAALSINGITLTGAGAAAFTQTNTCGTSLAAGANCTLSITFTPSAATSYSATLSIADNASGSPQTVNLSGTGTTPAAPIASVTPATLSFTSFVGTPSAAQVAQLSNTGSAALTIGGITLTGTGAANFAQTNTCGASPAAGASCNISVIFTPSAAAAFSATLSIADNASGSPQTVTLTGTGSVASAPVVSITPAQLTFTSTVGVATTAQTAQLSNTGGGALTITGISLTGTGFAGFAQTNTCGTSLAAGASCTISVIFTPISAGSFSASVSIADNASGSPQSVALTGTGIAVPSFQLTATPAAQSVRYGSGTSYTINVVPQGGAFTSAVTLTASGLPSLASATFSPVTVTPGSSTVSSTLTVQTIYPLAGLRSPDGSFTRPLLAFVGLLFVVTRKRRRQLRLLTVLLLASLAGLASLTGCGSSPNNANYTITITGTGGTQVQTTTVTLTLHE